MNKFYNSKNLKLLLLFTEETKSIENIVIDRIIEKKIEREEKRREEKRSKQRGREVRSGEENLFIS